tara:strand:- start:84 stop:983 length:900 start_codon:yes stop_codon:yes gene_type:complete
MYINCFILYSKTNNYTANKYYNLNLLAKVGQGGYGIIYEINKNYVIKIFKKSSIDTNINTEGNELIPTKNENREINFFTSYIKHKNVNSNYIIDIKAIGIICENYKIDGILIKKNTFIMIMPICVSIYKLLDLWKKPLINHKQGIEIVLNIMKKIINIQMYLSEYYNIINLDIKLDNFMIENKKKLLIENIINIDLGLIKTKNTNNYKLNYDYSIWPIGENIKLDKIPSYSICINGLEILFGNKFIETSKNMTVSEKLNILKNNKDIYNIFYNGLLLKLNLKQLQHLIINYLKTINNNK